MKDECSILSRFPDVIVSGGQSGADFGALVGAKAVGIATGGYAPKGFKTETGPRPELGSIYGLIESKSTNYNVRTEENIVFCSAVILVANNFKSPGSALTHKLALSHGKPIFEVPYSINPKIGSSLSLIEDIRNWLDYHAPSVLMFAGNRESKARGIEQWTVGLVQKIFERGAAWVKPP